MENMTIPMTSRTSSAQVTSLGTPTRGCAFGNVVTVDLSTETIIRDRKAVATGGHVAFVAYVPGSPAWSPPIC